MNKPGSSFFETDYYLIGETYPQENFAVLEIFENNLSVKIKDINDLRFSKTKSMHHTDCKSHLKENTL